MSDPNSNLRKAPSPRRLTDQLLQDTVKYAIGLFLGLLSSYALFASRMTAMEVHLEAIHDIVVEQRRMVDQINSLLIRVSPPKP